MYTSEEKRTESRTLNAANGQRHKRIMNRKRVQSDTIQRTTANAEVTVTFEEGTTGTIPPLSANDIGESGANYSSVGKIFADYFNLNLKSMWLSEIAEADKWSDKRKKKLNDYLRKPTSCAEPHAVINALVQIHSKNKLAEKKLEPENIKSVGFSISGIMNNGYKMSPCAVCKQWIQNSNKGTGNGTLPKWVHSPLVGYTISKQKKQR